MSPSPQNAAQIEMSCRPNAPPRLRVEISRGEAPHPSSLRAILPSKPSSDAPSLNFTHWASGSLSMRIAHDVDAGHTRLML
ncbi:uncharacterized protein ASPGLDRAFT_51450 [Aspergillus glaucus CBS 516.65]|uniref:Uncharacterized protein n=1 Tax=Aspergillus glaucus CBS 516.65 TaxID=1160497 RepID=A0A1L9V9I9_ASPGL|nr:hypothetical protein ASPGLDRAFT_51450 [Aspergillus glaucus CBS 516.65]OJJ80597.1 hypothetical protein ASPGLDRAFT_51450 [Aspergillus glaucus CBS 516.65]